MLFEKFVNTLAGNSGAEISEKGNGAGVPRRFPQFLGMRGVRPRRDGRTPRRERTKKHPKKRPKKRPKKHPKKRPRAAEKIGKK